MTSRRVFVLGSAASLLTRSARPQSYEYPDGFALIHATVIDGTGAPARPDQTVVVSSGRIVSVAAFASAQAPSGVRTVDAAGKFLIPGLWDASVNTRFAGVDHLRLLLANGITSVRDLGASWNHLSQLRVWRGEISKGTRTGPRIWASGPMLDGPGARPGFAVSIADPADAREAVRRLAREGADFCAIRDSLDKESFLAVADEAGMRGLPLAGEVPAPMNLSQACAAGLKSIERLDDILTELVGPAFEGREAAALQAIDFDSPAARALFAALAQNHAYVDTILAASAPGRQLRASVHMEYVPPVYRTEAARMVFPPSSDREAARFEAEMRLVRQLHDHGVSIVAGSNSYQPGLVPGFSLHDELKYLVQTGLAEREALACATVNPARLMGQKDLGTIEPGMLADLVLLDADPLLDIENTRQIRAVAAAGRLVEKPELQAMLADVERAASEWIGVMTPSGAALGPRPWPRKEITLAPALLPAYVGTYEFQPGLDMMITLQNGQLIAQMSGQGKLPLYAASEKRFFPRPVQAEIEFEKDGPKITGLILHQNGGDRKAPRTSDTVVERKEIDLPLRVLARYVGVYQLPPGLPLSITLEGDQLVMQPAGQAPLPLFAETETSFFLKPVDVQIEFVPGPDGNAAALIFHQGSVKLRAPRL